MPKPGILFLLLVITSCTNRAENKSHTVSSKVELNDSCYREMDRARHDAAQGALKYYVYGIAYPSAEIIEGYREKNIEVVSWGCVLSNNLLCYNKIADSIVSVGNK